jgi:hypothetical protein
LAFIYVSTPVMMCEDKPSAWTTTQRAHKDQSVKEVHMDNRGLEAAELSVDPSSRAWDFTKARAFVRGIRSRWTQLSKGCRVRVHEWVKNALVPPLVDASVHELE